MSDEPAVLPAEMSPIWRDDEEAMEEQYLGSLPDGIAIEGEVRRPFEHAAATVIDCLNDVRSALTFLRTQRDEINEEVRRLVAEEELLQRMARIAERAATEGTPPSEQPPEDPPG